MVQIVSDTRFLDEDSLLNFVGALSQLTQIGDLTGVQVYTNIETDIVGLKNELEAVLATKIGISSSSASWLEMVIVDVILRNRDRFGVLWATFESHYIRSLCGCDVFSYKSERLVSSYYRNPFDMIYVVVIVFF